MRLTLALVATLAATPLTAADGHRMLSAARDWTTLEAEGCGLACESNGVRPATDIPRAFQQNREGWLNSADASVIESKLAAPEHGIAVLRGAIMDGQDEGTTRVQVFNFAGEEVFSKFYDYKGDNADGKVKTWSVRARDHGQNGWRGVTIRYTMTDEGGGPDRRPNKNGISFIHSYRADASCQPAQNAGRGRAAERGEPAGGKKSGRTGGAKGAGKKGDGERGGKKGGAEQGGKKGDAEQGGKKGSQGKK
jgi:hypothetical protein